jgi:photosystem II stability/assembly factor-like uncharacterized protein
MVRRILKQIALAVSAAVVVVGCSPAPFGASSNGAVFQRLISQSFVDADNGWAVASECPSETGSTASVACRSIVYGTVDSGRTWSVVAHFLLSPKRIRFVDRETGWLIGSIGEKCGSNTCPNVVMLSQDGGKKWDRVSTVSGELVDAVAFSRNDAWAIGKVCGAAAGCNAEFVRTTTAGQIWDNQELPLIGSGFHLERFGRLSGWVGGVVADGPGTAMLGTVDGGSTWASLRIPCQGTWSRFDFRSPRDGWLICSPAASTGTITVGSVYHTSDAGRSWLALATVSDPPGPADKSSASIEPVGGFRFSSDTAGWLALRDGRLFGTDDGGRTWRKVLADAGGLQDVDFVDANRGWVLGESQVWRTMDSGKTWSAIAVVASPSS